MTGAPRSRVAGVTGMSGGAASVSGVNPRYVVRDDSRPVRRVMFGTRERADAFAQIVGPGWTVVPEGDPEWLPLFGEPGGPTTLLNADADRQPQSKSNGGV